ncbi:hypothetical protein M011DRAFT_147616 [Sporormia fimetaria CBS 119925]|uniref:Uncharacterized protein n=1 Tax=Sporormia fimetaria CBS 119925 TaxID=1340428 RepID=A0A6A6V7T6_9PLEO|nr:hypothetical protein M011DRAFT_147616 [Sporormia fimetaria CBS 119925]
MNASLTNKTSDSRSYLPFTRFRAHYGRCGSLLHEMAQFWSSPRQCETQQLVCIYLVPRSTRYEEITVVNFCIKNTDRAFYCRLSSWALSARTNALISCSRFFSYGRNPRIIRTVGGRELRVPRFPKLVCPCVNSQCPVDRSHCVSIHVSTYVRVRHSYLKTLWGLRSGLHHSAYDWRCTSQQGLFQSTLIPSKANPMFFP